MSKFGIGALTFARPLHTAIMLAFAFANKSKDADLHLFYGIHRQTKPLSKTLDLLQKELQSAGLLIIHYLRESDAPSCGASVQNLLDTLTCDARYEYFVKIDDDVIFGKGQDELMVRLLTGIEAEGVYFLMGQAVYQHIGGANPFCWEAKVENYRIVQRSNGGSPMETLTACSSRWQGFMKKAGLSTLCQDSKGTFMGITRRTVEAKGRSALVLVPSIIMQHFGLCSTIEPSECTRNWAPATSYEPRGVPIVVPYFDFDAWALSHTNNTQKECTVKILNTLKSSLSDRTVFDTILKHVEAYVPGADDAPLPKSPGMNVKPVLVTRKGDDHLRTNGTVVRTPTVVRRVIVKR